MVMKYWRKQEDAHGAEIARTMMSRDVLAHAARQPEPVEDQVHRNEPKLVGDHHRAKHQDEEQFAPREPEPRECVSRDAAEDEVRQRHDARDPRAVHEQDHESTASAS